jgi:hypothetical protein
MLNLVSKADETKASLYVDPASVKFWTPAYGKTFSVNVTVANVTGLYGYEFRLWGWNTAWGVLLDLVEVNVTPPAQWNKNYFIAQNSSGIGWYWLAVSALSPATPFSGNATLATLTFRIVHDPIYPDNVGCPLILDTSLLSDENAMPIDHDTLMGQYMLYSTKPWILVKPSLTTAKKNETFLVYVWVVNVVDLEEYAFTLHYDPHLLDVLSVKVGDIFGPSPFVYLSVIDHRVGNVTLDVVCMHARPSGWGLLAVINFTTIPFVWPDPVQNTTLHLYQTGLWGGTPGTPVVYIQHDDYDGNYSYTPIPGDVSSDGVVDLVDLRLVAKVWGTTVEDRSWDPKCDLKRDGVINIFDLVLVAKNQGRTDP